MLVLLFFQHSETIEKAKILLIDEDNIFLTLTKISLRKVPYLENLTSIENVEAAQNYLNSCVDNQAPFPDAIFVDLNMPGMSGMEFAQLYNEKYAGSYPNTKLVMLTSSISRREKAKALGIPAINDFMEKPLTIEKLNRLLL